MPRPSRGLTRYCSASGNSPLPLGGEYVNQITTFLFKTFVYALTDKGNTTNFCLAHFVVQLVRLVVQVMSVMLCTDKFSFCCCRPRMNTLSQAHELYLLDGLEQCSRYMTLPSTVHRTTLDALRTWSFGAFRCRRMCVAHPKC